MERVDEESGGDADRLLDVVVGCRRSGGFACGCGTGGLTENRHQCWSRLEKGLVAASAQRFQGTQPLLRGPLRIESMFLLLGGQSYAAFALWIANYGKVPRLDICAVGRAASNQQAVLEHALRN